MGKYCKDVVIYHACQSYNKNNMILREKSIVDEFSFRKGISSDDGKNVKFVCDAIYEAFNGERLAQLGKMNIEQWFESLKQKPISSLQKLREQCSDSDLMAMMKSRYCQSPSDIVAWSEHMSNNIDKFKSEVANFVAQQQQQQQQQQQTDSVEPDKS